jgi:diguanylate cyclase (GGDEF)-like protein
MGVINRMLFGGAEFDETEEYFRFQFRFLYIILLFGAVSSIIFIVSHYTGANVLTSGHINAQKFHVTISVLLAFVLYGRKKAFNTVAWLALINSFIVFISAMFLVPEDPLRVIWFFLNLPAVFLLLGRFVGVCTTVVSAICIIVGNRYLTTPYPPNAIATSVVAFLYISVFFYIYSSRPVSYFHRMLESNEKLRYLANHDQLTGVLNARTFYEVCDHMICVARRDSKPFSVLFVDLDHFKKVNDTYGHDAGDTVLRAATECMSGNIRECDVIGRVGGEEFSVYLPETDNEGAMVLAEKLRARIEDLMPVINGKPLRVTASIGVASEMPHHVSIADIQRDADHAMYHAKQEGRNRVSSLDAPCYVEQTISMERSIAVS